MAMVVVEVFHVAQKHLALQLLLQHRAGKIGLPLLRLTARGRGNLLQLLC